MLKLHAVANCFEVVFFKLQYGQLQYNFLVFQCGSASSTGRRRGARIGMAVIFTLDEFNDSRREFETFFFSHITLIEGRLVELRNSIEEKACAANATEYIMEVSGRLGVII